MEFPRRVENLIANLRSFPENSDNSIVRQPCRLDSVLEVVLEKYQIGKPRPAETIIESWKSIMGELNAHRCRPQRIDGRGRLIISVANQTLRQELNFQRSTILNRIRRLPGCAEITDVYLRHG